MRLAALTSVGLHLLLLVALTATLPRGTPSESPDNTARIEMLPQSALTGDRDIEHAPTAPADAASGEAAATPSPEFVPMPQSGPFVPMPPPEPQSPAPPAARSAALEEAIGTAIAEGTAILPAAPDSAHNVPPRYPEAARRRGEEGSVLLVLHIAPDGHVSAADLERSSGSAALDRAAHDAVLHWHFHPALAGNNPVDSTFETEVVFQFTDKNNSGRR